MLDRSGRAVPEVGPLDAPDGGDAVGLVSNSSTPERPHRAESSRAFHRPRSFVRIWRIAVSQAAGGHWASYFG